MKQSPSRNSLLPRISRLFALVAVVVLAFSISGCDKQVETLEAKEGGRVYIDHLFYQVQMSRILNNKDTEDSYYVIGQPTPAPGDTYFGVFMRVDNENFEHRVLPIGTDKMKIITASGDEFEPLTVKGAGWGYEPAPIGKGAMLPIPNTPAFVGPIRGGLILFRIPQADLDNRPLKLEIESTDGKKGEIVLDV
jgi:hypothetical protein